jgi:hypothetical protein
MFATLSLLEDGATPHLTVFISSPQTDPHALPPFRSHATGTMDFSFHFGEKVSQCEEIIGYCFNDKVLCAEALNTAGDAKSFYILDGFYRQMPKNGRLAVYGDSIAESYLCSLWVQRELDKR